MEREILAPARTGAWRLKRRHRCPTAHRDCLADFLESRGKVDHAHRAVGRVRAASDARTAEFVAENVQPVTTVADAVVHDKTHDDTARVLPAISNVFRSPHRPVSETRHPFRRRTAVTPVVAHHTGRPLLEHMTQCARAQPRRIAQRRERADLFQKSDRLRHRTVTFRVPASLLVIRHDPRILPRCGAGEIDLRLDQRGQIVRAQRRGDEQREKEGGVKLHPPMLSMHGASQCNRQLASEEKNRTRHRRRKIWSPCSAAPGS